MNTESFPAFVSFSQNFSAAWKTPKICLHSRLIHTLTWNFCTERNVMGCELYNQKSQQMKKLLFRCLDCFQMVFFSAGHLERGVKWSRAVWQLPSREFFCFCVCHAHVSSHSPFRCKCLTSTPTEILKEKQTASSLICTRLIPFCMSPLSISTLPPLSPPFCLCYKLKNSIWRWKGVLYEITWLEGNQH